MSSTIIRFLFSINKKRNCYLATAIAVFSFVFFISSMVVDSMQSGIESTKERLGADLMIVPAGYESVMEGILLQSNPDTIYFERDICQDLSQIEEISQISPQIYIASLNASCCSVPVEIVGVDFGSDFVISPWISVESGSDELGSREVVVGYLVEAQPNDKITLYGTEFTVKARLAQTALGFDSTVFMEMETARDMIRASEKKAVTAIHIGKNVVSCYMANVVDGSDIKSVEKRIEQNIPGAKAISTDDMVGEVSKSIKVLEPFLKAMLIFLWIILLTILMLSFQISASNRGSEIRLLRILGYSKNGLLRQSVLENIVIAAAGCFIGISAGSIIVFPFKNLIASYIGLPYKSLSICAIMSTIISCMVFSMAIGVVTAIGLYLSLNPAENEISAKENV